MARNHDGNDDFRIVRWDSRRMGGAPVRLLCEDAVAVTELIHSPGIHQGHARSVWAERSSIDGKI